MPEWGRLRNVRVGKTWDPLGMRMAQNPRVLVPEQQQPYWRASVGLSWRLPNALCPGPLESHVRSFWLYL